MNGTLSIICCNLSLQIEDQGLGLEDQVFPKANTVYKDLNVAGSKALVR